MAQSPERRVAWLKEHAPRRRERDRAAYAALTDDEKAARNEARRARIAAETAEEKAAKREYQRQWRAKNRERLRQQHREQRGIVDAHGERQTGPCQICKTDTALQLDHDHSSGKIRGWLCNRCNLGLGYFSDDPVRLQAAAVYLSSRQG